MINRKGKSMGYCNADCEYLTTRHNCKKYNKGLTYSKFSSRSISTGTVHERCSECDKDHWLSLIHISMMDESAREKALAYMIGLITGAGHVKQPPEDGSKKS